MATEIIPTRHECYEELTRLKLLYNEEHERADRAQQEVARLTYIARSGDEQLARMATEVETLRQALANIHALALCQVSGEPVTEIKADARKIMAAARAALEGKDND